MNNSRPFGLLILGAVIVGCNSNQKSNSLNNTELNNDSTVVQKSADTTISKPEINENKQSKLLVGTWCANEKTLKIMLVIEANQTFIMNCIGKNNETQAFKGSWKKVGTGANSTIELNDESGVQFSFNESEFTSGKKWKKL